MTTSGDLLRQLFRSYTKRDDSLFRTTAETIIHEERLKNHRMLADELEKILINANGSLTQRRSGGFSYDIPKDRERGFPLMDIGEFHLEWSRLILPLQIIEKLQQIVEESHKKDLLASGGLKPTQRILFYGPPGCGKTLTAMVIASELNRPLVTVRFDAIVSSYLGETASNLRRVFEFIARGEWVVLFDEFDAIGKDRDNPFEHGELKRVVNSLLQLIDNFSGESLLIAATNHENLLDTAIWRRFESVVEFKFPKEQDRILLLKLFLGGMDTSELDFNKLGRNTQNATGSDLEQIAIEAARRAILDGRNKILRSDFDTPIHSYSERRAALSNLSHKKVDTVKSKSPTALNPKRRRNGNAKRPRTSTTA